MAADRTRLVALDWGSTRLRAWRLGPGGEALETRTSDDGASRLKGGPTAFEAALRAVAGDWLAPGRRVLACGMVGSAHGWREAAYVDCPLALDVLHRHLTTAVTADGIAVQIVPGLRCRGADGLPDVLRGEETQLVGLLAAQPATGSAGAVVLPGTHSKWVRLQDGRVERFSTHLTGELYALLRDGSVLGRLMVADAPFDGSAFDRGVAASRASRDLTRLLFSVRTLGLAGELAPAGLADYLSGLLIGAELAAELPGTSAAHPVAVAGDEVLARRYRRALAAWGRGPDSGTMSAVEDGMLPFAAAGLWRIAADAGWV